MEDRSLAEVVRAAAHGDRAAADELVRRFSGPVREAIHRRVGAGLRGRVDTEDLLQSTLHVAVRDLPGVEFQGERAFLSWLLTVADRRIRMAARYHRAERRDVRAEQPLPTSPGTPEAQTTPSEGAARSEEHERLRAAVALLDEPDRTVVALRAFEGLAFPEIARRTGLPDEHAARHRYLVALRDMGRRLGPRG